MHWGRESMGALHQWHFGYLIPESLPALPGKIVMAIDQWGFFQDTFDDLLGTLLTLNRQRNNPEQDQQSNELLRTVHVHLRTTGRRGYGGWNPLSANGFPMNAYSAGFS